MNAPRSPQHLLLYGGTFDPIHHGHLIPAQRARELLDADRILLLPANRSPHKLKQDPGASAAQRLEMLRLAIAHAPHFAIDPRELDRPGPSYTIDTLEQLHSQHPHARLTLLLGVDQLSMLHAWHRVREILARATIALLPRPGIPLPDFSAIAGHLGNTVAESMERAILDTPLINLSATGIRARARAGLPLTFLVPPAVETYIRETSLYR
ncbi:MAG TPA: nicotinate (nicotinamide) nucleotide adenylyltransferase [Phycisphaerae bacterium]|nr:nicotinate (nicotinamide) nucleotide adenylyltransferase [Phycisphaerae bacterium]